MCTGLRAETQWKTSPSSSETAKYWGFYSSCLEMLASGPGTSHIFLSFCHLIRGCSVRFTLLQVVHLADHLAPTSQLNQCSVPLGMSQSWRFWGCHVTPERKCRGELEGFVTRNAFSAMLTDSLMIRRGPVNLSAFCKGYCLRGGGILECGDDQKLPNRKVCYN